MWTCPKCGRTFKKQEQSHYCGKAPETIQLPYSRPVPAESISDIARQCYETGNHP